MRRVLCLAFLILVVVITAYPFVWMILSSFKSNRKFISLVHFSPNRLIPLHTVFYSAKNLLIFTRSCFGRSCLQVGRLFLLA